MVFLEYFGSYMINGSFSETLLEATVDNFGFRATWSPIEKETCILWFRDVYVSQMFDALGKFSRFDKRKILEFITRFSTSQALRQEIELRKFEQKISNLPPNYFASIDKLSASRKQREYRQLFNLDSVIEKISIDRKRKIMAKKFHPDAGGDNLSMTIINEAYEFLTQAN